MIDDTENGGEERLAPVTPLFGRRGDQHESASVGSTGKAGQSSSQDGGAPRRVRFTTAEDSGAEEAVRSRPDGASGTAADSRRAGPVDRYDADGWWIDPDTAPSDVDTDSAGAVGAIRAPRTGAPATRNRSPRPGDDVGTATGDVTPTLMRASDLLKPDSERPHRPVALPAHRGWDDASAVDSAAEEGPAAGRYPGRARVRAGEAAVVESSEKSTSARSVVATGPGSRANLSHSGRAPRAPRLRLLETAGADATDEATPEDAQSQRERGEAALLKKLRGRGMSVREARTFVIGLDIAPEIADDLIDEFLSLRYLDDAVLAEQLIYTATSRKGQGRRVIAQSLSARGIPREVIDAALEEVPDDDDERALEFARSKARSLAKLEPDVALRRLLGQLARRGFGGSSAMRAAKTALSEAGGSSVRFR